MYLVWCDYYEEAKNRLSYQNSVFNYHQLICGKCKMTPDNTKNNTVLCTSKKYISHLSIGVKFWYVILGILMRRFAVKNLLLQLFWGCLKNGHKMTGLCPGHMLIIFWCDSDITFSRGLHKNLVTVLYFSIINVLCGAGGDASFAPQANLVHI